MPASARVLDRAATRGADVGLDALVGFVATAALLAGLARPGFPLLRDWVATPNPPLSDAALGLGESAARAVPQDVALAWASRALAWAGLPVWPLTGLLTAVFCVWLAVAAGALVRQVVPGLGSASGVAADAAPGAAAGFWVRLPAVVVAVWNPFVVERLLQGHWSLLAGVAAVMTMPVLLAPGPGEVCARGGPKWARKWSRSVRSERATAGAVRVAAACAALAAAGLTPTGWVLAVIAAAVAMACAEVPGRWRARAGLALTATAAVTAMPWLLATVLAGASGAGLANWAATEGLLGAASASATGVAAFAARAEPGIGTLGSVLALGGIWNSEAVPPSRATWWAAAALVLVLLVWALSARGLLRSRGIPAVRATVPTALVTWLLVASAATGPGIAVLDALVGAVPGALLRDTQKFVALALPATVLAFAFAARALARRLRPIGASVAVTAVAIAAVPDAPGALWDQLRPVTYGDGWAEVAAIVDSESGDPGEPGRPGEPGDLLVLPAGSFRSTPLWADGRAVLDPAPRLLDTRVLVPGDLVVAGAAAGDSALVTGEGDRARRATEALLRGEDPQVLADLGVRWVLDELTSAGPRGESARTLGDGAGGGVGAGGGAAATLRFSDPELALFELPPATASAAVEPPASAGARAAVLVAHAAWLVTLAAPLVMAVVLLRAAAATQRTAARRTAVQRTATQRTATQRTARRAPRGGAAAN